MYNILFLLIIYWADVLWISVSYMYFVSLNFVPLSCPNPFPLPSASLTLIYFLYLYICFCFAVYIPLFYFWDSIHKWYHRVFIFFCLPNSLSIIFCRSICIAANGRILLFFWLCILSPTHTHTQSNKPLDWSLFWLL